MGHLRQRRWWSQPPLAPPPKGDKENVAPPKGDKAKWEGPRFDRLSDLELLKS